MAFQNTPRFFSGFWTPLFCEYSKLLFKIQHTLSFKLAHNGFGACLRWVKKPSNRLPTENLI